MERLTPLAAAFLEAEDVDPGASLAIGSLAVFEGPAPDFEEFVDAIARTAAADPALPAEAAPGAARPGGAGVGRRPRLRHPLAHPQHGAAGARRPARGRPVS